MKLAEAVKLFREVKPREHPSCSSTSGHRFREPHSGRYQCTKCGYDYERHGIPGFPEGGPPPCYYVDRVYAMPGHDE